MGQEEKLKHKIYDAVSGFTGGAPVTLHASGTQAAVVTTEHVVATAAVEGRFTFHVDTVNMIDGDVLELRIYQIILSGGASRVAYLMTYYGAQPTDALIKISKVVPNDLVEANALRFTLLQSFGAAGRNFPWKVLRIA
jgi:hypothetical protein